MIEQLAEKVNANAALVRRGQYLDTTFLLQVGAEGWLITVEKGRIASVAREGAADRATRVCAARVARGLDGVLAAHSKARLSRSDRADASFATSRSTATSSCS